MSGSTEIRSATRDDLLSIQQVLAAVDLDSDDVLDLIKQFFVAERNRNVIGTIGLEIYARQDY
jgi:N-acetylglutamate synthase-like GNAT family acetyltransferase